MDKEGFLRLTLEQALSLDPQEGHGGLAEWAAPLVAGASLIGLVCHIYPNGFVDVRLACDGTVKRRIDPALLKCPIRPDRKLHADGRARCWNGLMSTGHEGEYDQVNGLAKAIPHELYIGATVEMHDKYPLLSATSTMKSLHYHRSIEEYESSTTRNAETVVMGSLPEHLALLLTDDTTDMSYVLHESFSLEVGSNRVDTGYMHQDEPSAVSKRSEMSKASIESPEMIALRERRQAAADLFYSKQFNSFVARGQELFKNAESMKQVNYEPKLRQRLDEEGNVIIPMIDIGETEVEARKRVLRQKSLYEESAQCFRLALRRTPTIDPKMYGRMALAFLRARDFRGALVNCVKALTYFPHSPRLYFLQGQALLELLRVDEAFVSFDKALIIAKELRESDGDTTTDIPLIESYRKSAFIKKHKFVDKETFLGEIEVESEDPRQRDIDENLNMFNVYDSVAALTTNKLLPDIPVASKLVNPIALRLKYKPPVNKLRKSTKKLNRRSTAKLPTILKMEDQADLHHQEVNGCDIELFKWEEDIKGDDDLEIIIEMEIETENDVLELCVRKNDDISEVLDSFFKEYHKLFTHAQMRELRVELRSRLGEPIK